jgi:NAD(P)-dependent dehydrogenase (short-subunit alcohol dehydrogenase family)
MKTVFITGANRGLGLEFVRQYVAQGDVVHACCRRPGGAAELKALEKANREILHVHALDVTRTEAVQRLAGALSETAIDILINNAGVFGPKAESEKDLRQSLGHIDEEIVAKVLKINSVAPLVVAQAFTDHVARSAERKMVAIITRETDLGGRENVAKLREAFGDRFLHFFHILDPLEQGIVVGKSSAMAYGGRWLYRELVSLGFDPASVLVTGYSSSGMSEPSSRRKCQAGSIARFPSNCSSESPSSSCAIGLENRTRVSGA